MCNIDGFSIEFLTNFIHESSIWKNVKLVVLYNEFRPVINLFGDGLEEANSYVDINLNELQDNELKITFHNITGCTGTITERIN